MEQDPTSAVIKPTRVPWNKGKLVGAKPPLRPSHVWSIRTKLQIEGKKRDLALFNLAIDSKLRGCDVVAVRVDDVAPSGYAMDRATIRQKKTGRPVRFEVTDQSRMAIDDYLRLTNRKSGQFLFAGRGNKGGLTTRQYARLVQEWVASIGLDPAKFGTHSLRRTKAVLIYRRTGNLRAVQLLLGRTTYCPRTPSRNSHHISVPPPLWRSRDGEAAPRTWRHPIRRSASARWLLRLSASMDDRATRFAIRDQWATGVFSGWSARAAHQG